MTMSKLPTKNMLQMVNQNVHENNFVANQPNQLLGTNCEWDKMMQEVTPQPGFENVDECIEDQAHGMLQAYAHGSVYYSPIGNGAPSDHFKLVSHLSTHSEGEARGMSYMQTTNVTAGFVGPHVQSSNGPAFFQGDEGQLPRAISSHNFGRSGQMLQETHMQRPGKDLPHWTSANTGPEQNREIYQAIPVQKGINHQSGGGMAATCSRIPAVFSPKDFPFNISPQTEIRSGHNVAAARPSMTVSSNHSHNEGRDFQWTSDAHHRVLLDPGQCMQEQPVSNIQSEGHFRPTGCSNSEYVARCSSIGNDNTIPKQGSLTVNLPHGASRNLHEVHPPAWLRTDCARTHMDLLLQVGAFAQNAGGLAIGCMPCDTASVQPTIESTSADSSSLERLSFVDTILPSNLQNLEGLDAFSVTAAGGHRNELPSACSNGASKKERLSDLRGKLRDGLDGTGRNILHETASKSQADGIIHGKERLTAVRSEIRKGADREEDLIDGEPQQKTKRKKIRCRVQRDEKRQRGWRGLRRGTAQKDPQGANMGKGGSTAQVGKFAETGLSYVGETANSAEILPPADSTTKLCQDAFALVFPQDNTLGEESVTAGSGIYSSHSQRSLNMVADFGTGLDCEKPPFIDYLALSDQQHGAGTKPISSMPEPQGLTFFGCQDLVLYDPMYHQSQSKELCLFLGETSSTGSNGVIPLQGSSVKTTDIVPVQGGSNHLPLAKVNPDDKLQLILYNQKRDIVVSRFRGHKNIRAKVLLDSESQRVWLQLENGAGPKANDDPDKARHWEKQRRDMREKVECFIKKMHNVQGDRKFSPWKGSIVDSVVGAFLTQNVSDHLSSSAFMSVASRFPPMSKNSTLASCPDVTHMFSFERQSEVDLTTPSLERFPFSSTEESTLSRQGDCEGTDSICIYENTAAECGFVGPLVPLVDNVPTTFPCINNLEGTSQYCHNTLIIPQTLGTKQGDLMCTSDNGHNSVGTIHKDSGNSDTLEDISGAFHQPCTVRSSKARRMLNFGTDREQQQQQAQLCSTLEPDKQVSLAVILEGETAADNISDQHSESESAAGSSGSVLSVQDSNFQLSIVQQNTLDLDIQADTVQTSSRKLDVAAEVYMDSKVSKKRPMSLSSISGMERAQLEANQKGRKRNHHADWESVRKQALGLPSGAKESLDSPEPRSTLHEDSVNWDAVRLAGLAELADTIKERGMHHVLSGRIKAFLTSIHEEHGSVDLEWLRNLPSEKAREYLMSIHGLGVKSVECIRLLTLHHLAFPVDTNVGRICVRLGWVPIEPLPEEVQLHLVELYPIQETIQKYLWPRLCTLDQRTLYELHYQLITFGKVFCTKSKPNCNACPMRTECKHFASAYASAKPLLTGPETDPYNRICSGAASKRLPILGMDVTQPSLLEYPQDEPLELCLSMEPPIVSEIDCNTALLYNYPPPPFGSSYKEFIVEEPASPERTFEDDVMDIEDMGKPMYYYNSFSDYCTELLHDNAFVDHGDKLHVSNSFTEGTQSVDVSITHTSCAQFPSLLSKDLCCSPHQSSDADFATKMPCCNSQSIMSCNSTSERHDYSTDLVLEVAQTAIVPVPEAAQIPAPKLKSVGRLRTIHYVYELPDDHSLLKMVEVDAREKDDPCSYLLAIWSPGEIPESQQEIDELCRDDSSTHTFDRVDENVAGTLLIPCRTAMHGSFPLNGTYFQVNEVFADHASSLHPLQVSRSLIWSLRRRFVYFGTSVPNIFKGLSTDEIKDCFWRGHVCVRGFDRKTRAPKPLVCRLHFPISKQPPPKTGKGRGRKKEERAAGFSSTSHT